MHVYALTPRGYCHGVVHAIDAIRKLVADPGVARPITVLGMVVHNTRIVDDFKALGVMTVHDPDKTRLELLDTIDEGTVVITAHGVSQAVIEKAKAKGLNIVDTTCADVTESQRVVREYTDQGYTVFFIGKHNHPEAESAQAISKDVVVVEDVADVEATSVTSSRIAITNQTTMSLFDIYHVGEAIRKQYPNAIVLDEQCDATRSRQLAVKNQPDSVQHCFVVGDKHSNNTRKLVETAREAGIPATRIDSVESLEVKHLSKLSRVSVTSGASTPSALTQEVIRFLKAFDPDNPKTHNTKSNLKNVIDMKHR